MSDETQFLTLSVAFAHSLAEIIQMVGQTLFLLADVELFYVIDEFLLQAVFVVFHLRNLFQTIHDALAYLFHTGFLIRFDGSQECLDVVNLLSKFAFEGGTFLDAEVNQLLQSLFDGLLGSFPFFSSKLLALCFARYIGHTEQGVEPILRLGNTRLGRDGLDLPVIVLYKRCIDGRSIRASLALYPN